VLQDGLLFGALHLHHLLVLHFGSHFDLVAHELLQIRVLMSGENLQGAFCIGCLLDGFPDLGGAALA